MRLHLSAKRIYTPPDPIFFTNYPLMPSLSWTSGGCVKLPAEAMKNLLARVLYATLDDTNPALWGRENGAALTMCPLLASPPVSPRG